jgi:hypothetical protein
MKKIIYGIGAVIALVVLYTVVALPQGVIGNGLMQYVWAAPSGACGQNAQLEQVVGVGTVYTCQNGSWAQVGAAGGSGTVTSVTFTGDGTVLSSTPSSAVTTSGTLTAALANAAQNSVLAGPVTGGAGPPTYQTAPTVSAANMTNFPTLNQNTSGTAAGLSGTPNIAVGTLSATGQITSTVAVGTAPLVITSTTNIPNLNASTLTGGSWSSPNALGSGTANTIRGTTITATTSVTSLAYLTTTNCVTNISCSGAPAGMAAIAASASTVTVATSSVTANSEIRVQFDATVGGASQLNVTCNTGTSTAALYWISTRTPGTSFVISTNVPPVTNPACLTWSFVN